MWCTHLTWKMLGTRAEMLALKNNVGGECVCLLWCDDKSRVACKAAPPLFFLSFGTQLSFFFFLFYNAFGLVRFSSYKDQCWAEKVIIWIVLLNLHGNTRSTRFCNNRASLSAWLSFFLQHVGQHRSKIIMMKKLSRKSFIEAATCTAAKGVEKSVKRWGKRRINGIFLLSSRLQHRVLVHFFQVLLTWLNPLSSLKLNTFFCSLQWVEKVTAQMIPGSSPFVKFWHGSFACTIARLSPWSLWPFSFSLKSIIDAKMAGQHHLGLFLFLSGPFGAWFCEEKGQREKMKCTSFPFGMYTKPTAGRPRSAAMPRLVPRQ